MSTSETDSRAADRSWFLTLSTRLISIRLPYVFLIVFLGASAVLIQYRPLSQPSLGDRANWDYFSQVIVRGGVPYRDVVNIKSPLSAYLGAAAIVVTQPFGVRDIIAIRAAYLLMIALMCACALVVVTRFYGDLCLGLIAAATLLCCEPFVRTLNMGVQPKTPMVLFGLLSLWAISEDKPLLAGLCGMLSALSWQPGLLFAGVAGLVFSKYLTSWRDGKAARVVLGAALPLSLFLVYFWSTGALRDFYLWTFHFNATVYGPNELRTLSGSVSRLNRIIDEDYHTARIFFYASVLGIIVTIVREITPIRVGGFKNFLQSARRHAVIITALGYLSFCMLDLQGGADLIPLLPFVGIFFAVLVGFLVDHIVVLTARSRSMAIRSLLTTWGRAAAFLLVIAVGVAKAKSYHLDFPTLSDQDEDVAAITANLTPRDSIFVHGKTEVLVLSGLENASKYFLFDRGKDRYLDELEPGGFDGWLQRLKEQNPKVVVLDRLRKVDRRDSLTEWVNQFYVAHTDRIFTYYVRRDSE